MRRVLYAAAALVVLILLASCATTYQPLGATGGYEDYQTSGDQYYVYFDGNAYTSRETVYRFFLTRAAEIALNNHYRYFYILNERDTSTAETFYTPGHADTTRYVDVYRRWAESRYGNIGFLDTVREHSITVYTPPRAYTIRRPGFSGEVMLVNQPLQGQPAPFDAETVYRDGMDLKGRIDSENQQTELAGGAAAAAIIAIAIFFS